MPRNKQILLESNDLLSIKPIRIHKKTLGGHFQEKKATKRIGETSKFIVDYDNFEALVLAYGKETATLHGFELGLGGSEVVAVTRFLTQGRTFFSN